MGKKSDKGSDSGFNKGDRVFAKLKGYPYWPAKIVSVPNQENKMFTITFYGTYQTNPIKLDNMIPYNEKTKEQHGNKKARFFPEAMIQCENDSDLRLSKKSKKHKDSKVETHLEESVSDNVPMNLDESLEKSNSNETEQETEEAVSNQRSSKIFRFSNRSSKDKNSESQSSSNELVSSSKDAQKDENKEKTSTRRSERISSLPVKKDSDLELNDKESKDSDLNKETDSSGLTPSLSRPSVDSSSLKPKRNRSGLDAPSSNPSSSCLDPDSSNLNSSRRRLSARQKQPNKRYLDQIDETNSIAKKLCGTNISPVEDQPQISKSETNTESSSSSNTEKSDENETASSNNQTFSDTSETSLLSKEEISDNSMDYDLEKPNEITENEKDKEVSDEQNDPYLMKVNSTSDETKTNDINSFPTGQAIEENQEEIIKEKEKIAKKVQYINNVRLQIALFRMDFEIKKSLRVDFTDVDHCFRIMEDLKKLPIKSEHLFKAPKILETIKKCRKFRDSKIRDASTECYNKFCKILNQNPDHKEFTSEFEKEKAKFFEENMPRILQEKIFAEKLLCIDRKEAMEILNETQIQKSNIKSFDEKIETK